MDSDGTVPEAEDAVRAVLREVDHRVKNNLQMVSSLIQLQARRTQDPAVALALKAVLGRMGAVATVHRRLFADDPKRFEVADFLRDLVSDVAGSAGRDDIKVMLDLSPVTIAASSAAPLALVVNELIDNALRHAFPAGQGGTIRVSLSGDGACRVVVADDGRGLGGAPDGFGLTVARLLCRQLHAELTLEDAGPGLRATVTAPLPVPASGSI